MTSKRLLVVLVVAVLVILAAVQCGRRDPQQPLPTPAALVPTERPTPTERATADVGAWTDEVCTAVAGWAADVEQVPARLQAGVAQAGQPADVRRLLLDALQEASERNDELLSQLRDAGEPDVPGGESVARELESAFEGGVSSLDAAAARVRELPVDDPQRFAVGMTAVAARLLQAGADLSERTDQVRTILQDGELRAAFESSPACQRLQR